jgi:predicted transcriptional regulator
MGLAMVLVGVRYDIWLCLIGLFVVIGGSGEVRAAAVRTATGGLQVKDVMVHDPTTLEVSFPLSVVAPFLEATPGRVLPVLDAGKYVGLIAADYLAASPGALRVADVMDRLAPPLGPRDPLYPLAVESLLAAHRRAAAVIENGQVVGVIYAAHLEAALRRATSAFGAPSTSR